MSGNMERDSFVVYRDFVNGMRVMTDAQCGIAFKALASFALDGIEPEFDDPVLKIWFSTIRGLVVKNNERYARCVENGKKGGAPIGNNNARKNREKTTKNNQKQPKSTKKVETKTTKNNLNVNVNVNDNVNDNVNVINKSTTNVVEAMPVEEYGKKEINELINEFEYRLKLPVSRSKKTERYACKRLITKHGFEQACKLIRIAEAAQADKYAPRIGSILDLDRKQGELVVWGRQQMSKNLSEPEVMVL